VLGELLGMGTELLAGWEKDLFSDEYRSISDMEKELPWAVLWIYDTSVFCFR
jgi:hypothetical protein